MTWLSWRNATFALAVICGYQCWQGCGHTATTSPETAPGDGAARAVSDAPRAWTPPGKPPSLDAPAAPARTFHGIRLPAALAPFAPRPGEPLRAWRDRVLPVVELVIAPQRARVARLRDGAGLDAHQRAELDGAVQEAAAAIQARVKDAIAGGELRPGTLTPMAGVSLARDVLDIVDRGNTRFEGALAPAQRAALASHRFDFADYLVFSAPWENALHALD